MKVNRPEVIAQIEKMMTGGISREDLGWWAFDCLMEGTPEYEPGYEILLQDTLQSLQYFHDSADPLMRQFCPTSEEIQYYLKCLQGEEPYRRNMVLHWRV